MVENEIQVIERVRNEAVYQDLLEQGASVFLADILSRRLDTCVSLEDCLSPSISRIQNPKHMPDIEKAVTRICKAIIQQESIVFAVDHDMDGQGSAAVLWTAFVDYFKVPASRLSVITSHRLNEGYGITQAVVDRILATDASLIISADKGTSDEPRIKQLVDAGRDVVVTDHHQVPEEGPPISALACVNPARADSEYDPYVCGAGVAFLTMAMVRTALLKQEYLSDIPSLSGLMDYVAVATLADCVSIRPDKSYTNRAMVKRGIALINAQHRPCWQVFCQQIKDPVVTSQTIGFQLAPAVAAAGRLDWAETGFRFLTATTVEEAETHWAVLTRENTLRKNIEKTLRDKAFEAAASMDGMSILLYFEEGHSGVHGITASRLVEKFGKPSAMFAPKGAGAREGESTLEIGDIQLASGSFRGVPGFDTRAALQYISDHYPDILIAFGGHQGAAGATVAIENIKKVTSGF
jgi:single-stranded-DNA-specific exonuclease